MIINFNYFMTRPVRYAALFISSTAAVIATGVHFELSKSDWSGWVQAVGAIAAIFGSFALARNQASADGKRQRIESLQAKIDFTIAAIRLADDTSVCLDDTADKMAAVGVTRRRAVGVERLQQLLQALHVFSEKPLPPKVLSEILMLQREVAFTLTAIRELGRRKASVARLQKADRRTKTCNACLDRLKQQREVLEKVTSVVRMGR